MADTREIVARECRFAIHIDARHGYPDLHYVKEVLHYKDGTCEPNIRLIKDVRRDFYVTKPVFRGEHKQKKEFEELKKLDKYTCTQSDLAMRVGQVLDSNYDDMRRLSNSPYLYGTEITSTSLLKGRYMEKNKTHFTPYSVCAYDLEADMLTEEEDPIIATAVFKKELYISVTEEFVRGIPDVERLFIEKARKMLGELAEKIKNAPDRKKNHLTPVDIDLNNYKLHFSVQKNTVEMIRHSFVWIHERQPDWLAIWNMDYDIPKIIETLKRFAVDPADVLCDPKLPRALRRCEYKQGQKTKKKGAEGKPQSIDPSDQWHTLILTASFYVIDAMCVYRQLRLAKQKDASYSLDFILDKELGVNKLNVPEAEKYKKERWHIFMQTQKKLEYMVYAIFDSLSMAILDDRIKDLCFSFPGFAGVTDFRKANSRPKMIGDAYYYYALSQGLVLQSVAKDDDIGFDEPEDGEEAGEVRGLDGWIMTLPAHMNSLGLAIIEEDPRMRTLIRAFNYDSDATSAYPTCVSILNVSKTTTKYEIIEMEGIDEEVSRLQGINLIGGPVNASEFTQVMFGLPDLFELDLFSQTDGLGTISSLH